MVNSEQMEEWIREVEARPASAALILQYISRRLSDLSKRNEELLAENIELRTERKVDEYESRIANLEYQVDLLKRQLSGAGEWVSSAPAVDVLCVILYNAHGQVLRANLPVKGLQTRTSIAALNQALQAADAPPRMLITGLQEELAFIFDSGRAVARPVEDIRLAEDANSLDWNLASLVEPRGNEELTVVTPVGLMALYDCCVQISRRGLLRKIMRSNFEGNLAKEYIGSGIKAKPDKNCVLALCGKDDLFVLVSQEGFVLTTPVSGMPYTAEEGLKLSVSDHIVSGFPLGKKPFISLVTQNGKVINREVSWLEQAETNKTRGQAVISPARREAGTRLVGASAVDENDWAATLRADGKIMLYSLADLFESGSLGDESELIDFVTFCPDNGKKNETR